MNILGLVFGLLLILSYTFFACWEKQTGSRRLQQTYLGHQITHRKVLNSYVDETYRTIPFVRKNAHQSHVEKKIGCAKKKEKQKDHCFNEECAKINLWPLIQEGQDAHPVLYATCVQLFSTFYKTALFKEHPRLEYRLLDQLLIEAKAHIQQNTSFALEKISFSDKFLQKVYYKMLKGTQQSLITIPGAYPSILDYLKVESSEEKICLFHAHTNLLLLLFGNKNGEEIFHALHQKKPPPLTEEYLEKICGKLFLSNSKILDLIALGKKHKTHSKKRALVENEHASGVSLRHNIYRS